MQEDLCVAICDDDADDRALLLRHIQSGGAGIHCLVFERGEELLCAFQTEAFDLIFLDIFLAGQNGMEIARTIRRQNDDVVLAFTTASTDYTLEGYGVNAYKYLIKPVSEKDVTEALELGAMKRRHRKTLTLLVGGILREFVPNDILYFEAAGNAVRAHMMEETLQLSQRIRMDDLEKKLPSPQFLRCHRGFIVNLRRVQSFDGTDFIMENGGKAYVRVKDERKMKAAYEHYIFALARGEA